MKKLFYIILFLMHGLSFAQKLTDSLDFYIDTNQKNNLNTRLEKQLNTFYLTSFFLYTGLSNSFIYNLNENYNSTLVNSTTKSIRDEHYFNFKSEYLISRPLRMGLLASNNILSDNRSIEINSASVSDAAVFTTYTPEDKIYISPFLGYTNNRQIGVDNPGLLLGFEGLVDNIDLTGTNINADMKYRDEDISPRKNTLRNLAVVVTSNFTDKVSNNIGVKLSQSRKDFYYAADSVTSTDFNVVNNIQSRTESGYLIEDRLKYGQVLPFLSLDFLGRINYRTIDRDTRYKLPASDVKTPSVFDATVNELKIELESDASINTDKFNSTIRANYSERNENNVAKNYLGVTNTPYDQFFNQRSIQESMKDNSSIRGSISITGDYDISRNDHLFFSLYQNKLRYDTPSSQNFDDRDELLSMIRLKYSRALTPFFTAFINVEGTYNHIVYIFSESSSNNNVNRVIRLSSGGDYKGYNLSSLNSFEVSANYTVYDFEDLTPNFQSYSFRQLNIVDSTTFKFSSIFYVNHYGYVKLSEQGDLKWASFSTRPIRYLEEIYSEPKLNFVISKFTLSGGMRLFILNTYTYDLLQKIPESEYLSIAPVSEISLILNTSLFFRMYGYYEFITTNNTSHKKQISFILQSTWNF
ncbi:MAG: hypothetical protein P4L27_01015 [Ignavibacteriaceae bacterium]|nr:hypothetical protein [Ignavibacteriaceae bacterium]